MKPTNNAFRELPGQPGWGRIVDARLHLLDRQLVDPSGDPVGTVDDVEFDGITAGEPVAVDTPAPRLSAIMSGHVLATRILGGQPPRARLQAIPWRLVERVGIVVELRDADFSSDSQWREHWLRDHVIAHIPGGRHAAE
jgi:sporulation protein YlmC with PRC-barrel domain